MMKNETAVAYNCPSCGTLTLGRVDREKLSGKLLRLRCECGGMLEIASLPEGKVRLSVPCLICPTPHVYTVSEEVLFGGGLLELNCPVGGIPLFFAGEAADVHEAAERAEDILREAAGISDAAEKSTLFRNHGITSEILAELHELIRVGAVCCRCDKPEIKDIRLSVGYDGVTVECSKCGAARTLSARTTLDAEYLCSIEKLYLD